MHDLSTKFEIYSLINVSFIDVQKYVPNILLNAAGTVAPDVFGHSDAFRGVAHSAIGTQTIHKQFLMSRQQFQLNEF